MRIAPLDDDIPQVQELLDHYIAALEQTAQYAVARDLPGQGGSMHP